MPLTKELDWTKSMQQTYEYYLVDPNTWGDVKRIDTVKSCSIDWDSDSETLLSASLDIDEFIGEAYIRIYLITIQNGVERKHPLATVLVQTPSMSFDGRAKGYRLDAYSPLIELKEKSPAIGYFVEKDANVMDSVYMSTRNNMRAPVVKPICDEKLINDFVAEPDDHWLTFSTDLMSNAKYKFDLDEMGRTLFVPKQDTAALQPVWTFTDDNSSILYPEIDLTQDIYGIPNVVEVVCSSGNIMYSVTVANEDTTSPLSTVNRGRDILYRDTNPSIVGTVSESKLQEYAELLLRELSTVEHTVTYTHGYCPVRINDCVRLNYSRAGLTDIKARVTSQSISCEPGCPVTETAVYTSSNKFRITKR